MTTSTKTTIYFNNATRLVLLFFVTDILFDICAVSEALFQDQIVYVEVVLPLPLGNLFTYVVPPELQDTIIVGGRVIVQFGDKKILTAIVTAIHDNAPLYDTKHILDVLDTRVLISPEQFKLFNWIATYYVTSLGNVVKNAIPSGLRLSSESNIQLHPEADLNQVVLSLPEQLIVQQLEKKGSLTYDEAAKITTPALAPKLLKKLTKAGIIISFEKAKEKYSPKTEKYIRINPLILEENKLEDTINELDKKPKQLEILLGYIREVNVFQNPSLNDIGVIKKYFLTEEFSASSLKTLVKNEVLVEETKTVSRFETLQATQAAMPLSTTQEEALHSIYNQFEQKDTVLLHGITGSGKTEIYIQMIQDAIDNGRQVLYLLPEIALTTQIVARLKAIFGRTLGVYHSRFSDNERVDIWKDLIDKKTQVIVGVRSSIFLPFEDLALIIVDEEHDSSYKQHEPSPRYNARDSAIVLANLHKAKVLLGSATPSVESYYKAKINKFGFVSITERYGNASLPEIIPTENKNTKAGAHNFATSLMDAIKDRLNKREQTIIFQNRRGYSPYIQCEACEAIPQCKNCNVNLTYHMYSNELRCHYCGHTQAPTQNCGSCGSTKMHTRGHGTEKIEDDLKLIYPEAIIQRMDLDTTRKKNSLEQIIEQFQAKQIDILVGTQMVTKGLDFENVSLVGVFDADRTLNYPDYRSREKAFQLMTQVSGRAGRAEKKGEVIIQTATPNHNIFEQIKSHNYIGFYNDEIRDRETYFYPPFSRLIKIIFKHPEQHKSMASAQRLSLLLKVRINKNHVLGPQEPVINRVRNKYLTEILVKIDANGINLHQVKDFITNRIMHLQQSAEHRQTHIIMDVDPS